MADIKKTDLFKVPYSHLVIREGFNLRTDYGNMDELVASIKENGIRQPLRGYRDPEQKDHFIIVEGHRRHKAMSVLYGEGVEVIAPFVLESQKYSDEQRVIDMFIMNDGKNLTPLEQAEGVRRMLAYNYEEKDIAAKIGRSVGYVGKLASLGAAPRKLKNLIAEGTISASLAMEKIAKGEAEQFLIDIDAGVFTPQEEPHEESNGVPKEKPEGKARITKSNLNEINSWKEFKKYAKTADDGKMSEDGARFFKYLCRMMNNEVGEQSFKSFFSK